MSKNSFNVHSNLYHQFRVLTVLQETHSKFEEWQRMLAQHVLPMRRSLTSESISSQASSQACDLSPGSEASVRSAGKQAAKEVSTGAKKEAKKPTQPAKRGTRLRTESWTISEDKALHAATAVADVILIDQEQEIVNSANESSEVKESVAVVENIDVEEETAAVEEKNVDENKKKITEGVISEEVDSGKEVSAQDKVKAHVTDSQPIQAGQKTESKSAVPEVESNDDTANKVTVVSTQQKDSTHKPDSEKIPEVSDDSRKTEELEKPETVKIKERTESSTSQDEASQESAGETSSESLRLVLEDDDQETEDEPQSSDGDKDNSGDGFKPSQIPMSDSMPELSKICERPDEDAGNHANLPVPKLTPVKDMIGRPIVPQAREDTSRCMEFSPKEAPALSSEDQSEAKETKEEETVDVEGDDNLIVQEVNSRLMADLTKHTPNPNDVVVLATWSVSSEDDVELDVTGATGDSMDDEVLEADADRLKKAVSGETGREAEIVVPESDAEEMDETLREIHSRLDDILRHDLTVEDIEEEIVSDVREQIDDIVTAVELNESRDEEMSRSLEASPEKDEPEKSGEEDIDEEIREQLDDIITAVELNESSKGKETTENNKEAVEKSQQRDSFEDYLLQGHKSPAKAAAVNEEGNVTTEKEKNEVVAQKEDITAVGKETRDEDKDTEEEAKPKTKTTGRQSSEDSERYVYHSCVENDSWFTI